MKKKSQYTSSYTVLKIRLKNTKPHIILEIILINLGTCLKPIKSKQKIKAVTKLAYTDSVCLRFGVTSTKLSAFLTVLLIQLNIMNYVGKATFRASECPLFSYKGNASENWLKLFPEIYNAQF